LNNADRFHACIEDLLRYDEKQSNDFSGGLIFLWASRIRITLQSGIERFMIPVIHERRILDE